jgi:hypothetical protein
MDDELFLIDFIQTNAVYDEEFKVGAHNATLRSAPEYETIRFQSLAEEVLRCHHKAT